MLVVGVLTQPDLYEKMVSNLVEAEEPRRLYHGPDHLRQLQH